MRPTVARAGVGEAAVGEVVGRSVVSGGGVAAGLGEGEGDETGDGLGDGGAGAAVNATVGATGAATVVGGCVPATGEALTVTGGGCVGTSTLDGAAMSPLHATIAASPSTRHTLRTAALARDLARVVQRRTMVLNSRRSLYRASGSDSARQPRHSSSVRQV